VEDPERHRVTAPNVTIDITNVRQLQKNTVDIASDVVTSHSNEQKLNLQHSNVYPGYWMHRSPKGDTLEPLFTRYQPLNCSQFGGWYTSDCIRALNVEQYNPYEFVWKQLPLSNITMDNNNNGFSSHPQMHKELLDFLVHFTAVTWCACLDIVTLDGYIHT
jgi:hypothetical protein